MHNRLTSRKRPERGASQGNTVPARGESKGQAPRLPHERDESADSQDAQEISGRRVGRQAHADVERGLVDTGKGPALGAAYDKVREGAADAGRKPGS